ncbi:MAG: CDP-diacylglycerol--glycerol-3-phosphate 3-phosphatidyltransferase [Desulfobacteraceae bacterium]|nr:CDP-diacylglycerol--glycerol-3-phosphate 3-phosphatidyltransferase [Desulfobacteraceae bacterium]
MTFYEKYKKIVFTPNFLTLLRIFAIPVIIIFLLFDTRATTFFAALIFSIASVTDYLDGYLARKYGLVSSLGKMLDPLADKLLISSVFIMLVSLDFMPAWIACVIVGREIAVTGLRSILAEHGEDVAASMLGKYKTGFQIAAVIPLTLHYSYFGIDFITIGMVMLYGALIFTLWSGIDYFMKSKKLLHF